MKSPKKILIIVVTATILSLTLFTGIFYFVGNMIDDNQRPADVSVSFTTLPQPVSKGEKDDTNIAPDNDDTNITPDNVIQSLSTLPKIYELLPVSYVSQLPNLPTGCEITSLTTVLNYLGYEVEKEYMADNYLDKLSDLSGSFYDYFIGSPYTPDSWGCFAPAITNSANRYLSDNSSGMKAYNISNSSIRALFSELCNGNPVIVWTSMTFNQKVTYVDIKLNDGTIFQWPNNEHCVVLIGFNLDNQTVTLSDPLEGIVERDMTQFIHRYRELYKQAVVIK